jgi:hypothetical protein
MDLGAGASRPSAIEELNDCCGTDVPTITSINEDCPLKRAITRAKGKKTTRIHIKNNFLCKNSFDISI